VGIHAGTLTLDGHRPNAPRADASVEETPVLAEARDALVGLGWKRSTARAAVHAAASRVGRAAPLETVIREALQCRGSGQDPPAVMRAEAREALVGMGWRAAIARAAVDAAASHVDTHATLETLIREALRRCMKPV
jgi:Holliday junction resolvasome RuvABC DNA-binding subunit